MCVCVCVCVCVCELVIKYFIEWILIFAEWKKKKIRIISLVFRFLEKTFRISCKKTTRFNWIQPENISFI